MWIYGKNFNSTNQHLVVYLDFWSIAFPKVSSPPHHEGRQLKKCVTLLFVNRIVSLRTPAERDRRQRASAGAVNQLVSEWVCVWVHVSVCARVTYVQSQATLLFSCRPRIISFPFFVFRAQFFRGLRVCVMWRRRWRWLASSGLW